MHEKSLQKGNIWYQIKQTGGFTSPLEVVGRSSETQLEVDEHLNSIAQQTRHIETVGQQ